ncbi:MAG: hypothetical protein ABSF53_17125 [Terracidiphilus sp.]|jgi:hypothetical protein
MDLIRILVSRCAALFRRQELNEDIEEFDLHRPGHRAEPYEATGRMH